jgi:hypothetical protein
MPDRDQDADESAPEDTFALVGNGVCAEIPRALGDGRPFADSRSDLSLSELRGQIDVGATPRWEREFAATDRALTVASTDPWLLDLHLECEGDVRRLTVVGSLDVRSRQDTAQSS